MRLGFEGGQTPLQKRLPKINTYDPFEKKYDQLSLGRVQRWIDRGQLDASKPITMYELVRSGCLGNVKEGVILREFGAFSTPVNIQVTEATPEAAGKVVKTGGSVTLAWYNRLGLRALLKPEKWEKKGLPLPAWARPPPKMEKRYPDRDARNLPIRVVESMDDVAEIVPAWEKTVYPRARSETA